MATRKVVASKLPLPTRANEYRHIIMARPDAVIHVDTAETFSDSEPMATEIVKRYNSHAALVQALKAVKDVIDKHHSFADYDADWEAESMRIAESLNLAGRED